ncbi:hypothetical protein ACFL2R_02550 [Patescibacteria group bacterium]
MDGFGGVCIVTFSMMFAALILVGFLILAPKSKVVHCPGCGNRFGKKGINRVDIPYDHEKSRGDQGEDEESSDFPLCKKCFEERNLDSDRIISRLHGKIGISYEDRQLIKKVIDKINCGEC